MQHRRILDFKLKSNKTLCLILNFKFIIIQSAELFNLLVIKYYILIFLQMHFNKDLECFQLHFNKIKNYYEKNSNKFLSTMNLQINHLFLKLIPLEMLLYFLIIYFTKKDLCENQKP